jgi:hypothetical protein
MSVEDIVSGMEYQELTAIKGRPSYENVNTICRQIYANVASVDSLRGGPHGHLGQIMTPTTYLTVTETPYNIPPNPGTLLTRTTAAPPPTMGGCKGSSQTSIGRVHNVQQF